MSGINRKIQLQSTILRSSAYSFAALCSPLCLMFVQSTIKFTNNNSAPCGMTTPLAFNPNQQTKYDPIWCLVFNISFYCPVRVENVLT